MTSSRPIVGWRKHAHPIARGAEAVLRKFCKPSEIPPLIILGPPRSGTTLFYQAMTARFRTSYICNYAGSHEGWPCLSTLLAAKKIRGYSADFSSEFGFTPGRAGPSEGRSVWSSWFGYHYCDEKIGSSAIDECRRTVWNIVRYVGAPFVTKNPDHCVRLRALDLAFPNAVYVRISRDPIEIARSVLNARKNLLGSYEKWFAVRPPEIPLHSELSVSEQVALQIYYLENRIDKDFSALISDDRQIVVNYADFCSDPIKQLERVASVAEQCGLALEQKRVNFTSFRKSSGKKLPDKLQMSLIRAFANLPANNT